MNEWTHEQTLLYNFEAHRIEITTSNSSSIHCHVYVFLASRCLAVDYFTSILCLGNVLIKPLSSNGHIVYNITFSSMNMFPKWPSYTFFEDIYHISYFPMCATNSTHLTFLHLTAKIFSILFILVRHISHYYRISLITPSSVTLKCTQVPQRTSGRLATQQVTQLTSGRLATQQQTSCRQNI
jgi:hypothetical protein